MNTSPKVTGANSHPALQFESRGLRRRAPVVESHGRHHGEAAVALTLGYSMRIVRIALWVVFLLIARSSIAGTTLDFWHSYVHAQSHQTHYSFHIAQYKRGLFWGSCGPSTKSLQWSFNVDLAGEGPVFPSAQLTVSDDNGKSVHVVSGQVVTDLKRLKARIEIEIESAGNTNKFIGNGEYSIKKIK